MKTSSSNTYTSTYFRQPVYTANVYNRYLQQQMDAQRYYNKFLRDSLDKVHDSVVTIRPGDIMNFKTEIEPAVPDYLESIGERDEDV
jgi:hypothetical protein